MSLSQYVLQIWKKSNYAPPRIPLLFYGNEYMAVIDDTQVFLRFMSSDGQIFLALNFNCEVGQTMGDSVYVCNKIDPILCSPSNGPESSKDIFVLNNIAPLL